MNTSCQKQLPFSSSKITGQLIELPSKTPPEILISEKEYLVLKSELSYFRGMHKKALLREETLKKTIKEQQGQIRDLRNRLFGKKSEKKCSVTNESITKSTDLKRP